MPIGHSLNEVKIRIFTAIWPDSIDDDGTQFICRYPVSSQLLLCIDPGRPPECESNEDPKAGKPNKPAYDLEWSDWAAISDLRIDNIYYYHTVESHKTKYIDIQLL